MRIVLMLSVELRILPRCGEKMSSPYSVVDDNGATDEFLARFDPGDKFCTFN